MSEPNTPPPPPEGGTAASGGSNKNVMIVLAYLWLLALIPLLVEKENKEVQWHAKHGLVILGLEVIIWVVLTVISATGFLACLGAMLSMFIWLAFIVVRIICIVKGVNGQRFTIQGVSQYADKF
jgi:uncharacterized membrane protein